MGNEYLSKYDLYMRGTHGYETGKVLYTVTRTTEELDIIFEQMRNGEGELKDYSEFFTYTLKAEYLTGMHTVYIYSPSGDCIQENVRYGETYKVPDYWIRNIGQSTSQKLIGWDTDNDGKADILPNQQFTVIKDMVLHPVMAAFGYTIKVIDFDGNETQYNVAASSPIPEEILTIINSDPGSFPAPNEGSFYSGNYWQIITTDFVAGDNGTPYFKGLTWEYKLDITVMPACDIRIKGIAGDLYSILFEYYLFDDYGNQIDYQKKHDVRNISKEKYEQLCAEYDKEYDYLRSDAFYTENDSPEFAYSSRFDGEYDLNSEAPPDAHGVIRRILS